MDATFCSARHQHHENRCPLFNQPSRWSLRMSRLRHPSVVVFLFRQYQLPDPAPPNTFHLPLFAEIIRQLHLTPSLLGTHFFCAWAANWTRVDMKIIIDTCRELHLREQSAASLVVGSTARIVISSMCSRSLL